MIKRVEFNETGQVVAIEFESNVWVKDALKVIAGLVPQIRLDELADYVKEGDHAAHGNN